MLLCGDLLSPAFCSVVSHSVASLRRLKCGQPNADNRTKKSPGTPGRKRKPISAKSAYGCEVTSSGIFGVQLQPDVTVNAVLH